MSKRTEIRKDHPRSSRDRYQGFVQDYKRGTLDDSEDGKDQKSNDGSAKAVADASAPKSKGERKAKRRQYVREYLRWLRPHRYAVGALFALALLAAGLEMVEPLFMRFIVDKVLLIAGLDTATRLARIIVSAW
jgi:ATP-binding cassette subfamily B protein/subfamily B ATP-binding cassette protein MsbA